MEGTKSQFREIWINGVKRRDLEDFNRPDPYLEIDPEDPDPEEVVKPPPFWHGVRHLLLGR